jgi:hypothetical protein
LLAAVGLTIALGSLVALVISENEPLFGLRTARYSTAAVLAIVAEGVAVLLLTPVLASTGVLALHRRATARTRRVGGPRRWPDRSAMR